MKKNAEEKKIKGVRTKKKNIWGVKKKKRKKEKKKKKKEEGKNQIEKSNF